MHFATFLRSPKILLPADKSRTILPQQLKLFREECIRKYQKSTLKKFDDEIEKTEAIVVAMYENYAFIIKVITSLDAAGRQLSWQGIEKKHFKEIAR